MAYEDRSYSGAAVITTLTTNITPNSTNLPIANSTGWPDGSSGPFHVAIAPANNPDSFSEVIRCSGRTGLLVHVQSTPVTGRGWDGTTAAAHLIGSIIAHVFTATDADEANQHIVNVGLDHHTQYLTIARHDTSTRHGISTLPVGGTPATSAVGDTSQAGTSTTLAKSDHRHARENFGPAVSSGAVNADGSLNTVSRSNHSHAGGVPILTSTTRPASPITGETILESDTRRPVMWTGSRWQRGTGFSSVSRTGAYVGRNTNYPIPSGGGASYILPWNAEIYDSDGFMPTPDGTTTHTLTTPSIEAGGLYLVYAFAIWGTVMNERSFMEIIHQYPSNIFHHRVSTHLEDRAGLTAILDLAQGHTVQLGLWQLSGADRNITYAHMYLFRLMA